MPDLPKEPSEALALARRAREQYRFRDDRQVADEAAYKLTPPPRREGDSDELLTLNDAQVQVDASTALMATSQMDIQVVAQNDPDRGLAQRMTAQAKWWVREWERRYARQTGRLLHFTLVHSLNLYGWPAARLLLNPKDPDYPWDPDLLDPRGLYPCSTDSTPECYVHYYRTTIGALERRFGKRATAKLAEDKDARARYSTTVQCVAYYSDTQMAVLAGGSEWSDYSAVSGDSSVWVKPPTRHGYGFNPVCHMTATGLPFPGPHPTHAPALGDQESTWDEWQGTGVLQAIRPVLTWLQRVALMRMNLLEESSDPTAIAYVNNPRELKQVPHGPAGKGGEAVLKLGENYAKYPPPPQALQFATALMQEGMGQMGQANLSPAVLGATGPGPSFGQYLAMGASVRSLKPRMVTLQLFWQELLLRAFALYARKASLLLPVPYTVEAGDGARTYGEPLLPQDLIGRSFEIDVQFADPDPRDQTAMMQAGAQMLQVGMAGPEWIHRNLLHSRNPQEAVREARLWKAQQNPALAQLADLWALSTDPTVDEKYRTVATMLFEAEFTKFSLATSQAMAPQVPPAAAMGPGGTPPALGLPNPTLPDEMAQGAGLPGQQTMEPPLQPGAAFPAF